MTNFRLDIEEIKEYLPHRYPLLLIDKVLEYKPNEYLVAIKNVTVNEQIFQGHFPNKAIYPGVYIVEGMAQASGLLFILQLDKVKREELRSKNVLFTTINNCKFRKMVSPGDQIVFACYPINIRPKLIKTKVIATVNDIVVAEAVISAIVD